MWSFSVDSCHSWSCKRYHFCLLRFVLGLIYLIQRRALWIRPSICCGLNEGIAFQWKLLLLQLCICSGCAVTASSAISASCLLLITCCNIALIIITSSLKRTRETLANFNYEFKPVWAPLKCMGKHQLRDCGETFNELKAWSMFRSCFKLFEKKTFHEEVEENCSVGALLWELTEGKFVPN